MHEAMEASGAGRPAIPVLFLNETDRLDVHFQRKMCLVSGRTVGFEALLRRTDRKHDGETIPALIRRAERTQAINEIGRWVLERACTQLAEWRNNPARAGWSMAVNISPAQIISPTFIADVIDPLVRHALPPDALILEITEQASISCYPQSAAKLRVLADFGIRISLDDFGTGLSNMSRLHALPISEMKIDRCFIAGIEESRKERIIVQLLLHMAEAMDICAVAEGIENARQLRILTDMGCVIGQGFHLERPKPAGAIRDSPVAYPHPFSRAYA